MPRKRVSSQPSIWMCKGLGNRLKAQWGRRFGSLTALPRWNRTCKFFPRAARAFFRGENSSCESRCVFYRVKILLASRGDLFSGWKCFSRAAGRFRRRNREKFGGLEILSYVCARKIRRWSTPAGGANQHRGKLPQISFRKRLMTIIKLHKWWEALQRGH